MHPRAGDRRGLPAGLDLERPAPREPLSAGCARRLLSGHAIWDWSGQISSLEYKGHNYFGNWNPAPYSPKLHDAIMGPVEEFLTAGTGLGYPAPPPRNVREDRGRRVIRKPQERSFQQFKTYEIVDPGKWEVKKKSDSVEFIQTVKDPSSGYAYRYSKTVQLIKGRPEMALVHRLKNTGSNAIESDVYEHNFYMIDGQPTGPDVVVRFPFEVHATQDPGDWPRPEAASWR